jgi:hypothetical protein
MMSISKIQSELKAPKNQYNTFGKYKYRSCEDIVEAVKPLLANYGYYLVMSDDVVSVNDRVYIKAICKVMENDKVISESSALAREPLTKKGMDDSQITGTASSYARKYALNGLFAIDDTKDADSMDNTSAPVAPPYVNVDDIVKKITNTKSRDELMEVYKAVIQEVGQDKKAHALVVKASQEMASLFEEKK